MEPNITKRQRAVFESRGLIRLESFLPAAKVTRAREAVFRHLAREGIWRDGAWQLDQPGLVTAATAARFSTRLTRHLGRLQEVADLVAEEARQAAIVLLGEPLLSPMTDRPQILFTLPNAASWTVPHGIWHLDLPRIPHSGIPGVQVFTFLHTVAPGGGGTLVVEGSHRLLNENRRIRSKQFKNRLRQEPYFRDLMSKDFVDRHRFVREPGRLGDVDLQVVELYGQPGDVFLMDLRVLHTLAPNASRVPRIMLTQRFLRESLRSAVYGGIDPEDPDSA